MTEASLQIAILQALRFACPKAEVYAIPLGGSRNPIEGANLKRQGVRAGVADLCVILPGKVGWIEVKTEKGRLTAAQKDFAGLCKQYAIPHCIARSIDDAITAVRAWSATP